MARHLILGCMAAAVFALPNVWAQTGSMADPTRPPASVAETVESGESGAPVLQSVMIPKKGRAAAIINGQHVRLGDKFGESRLVKVSEQGVVLEGPDGAERLLLTPGVEKTYVKAKSPAAKRGQGGG
ncbi:hypothetical protein [Propionivibrio soli]|uniref:hypothetical protein n=1 Tax=Propionivibrio soli TaxID=2976531 RepID=UPI0021E93F00|nr:hypothetical protein [Propionivibrio soli]